MGNSLWTPQGYHGTEPEDRVVTRLRFLVAAPAVERWRLRPVDLAPIFARRNDLVSRRVRWGAERWLRDRAVRHLFGALDPLLERAVRRHSPGAAEGHMTRTPQSRCTHSILGLRLTHLTEQSPSLPWEAEPAHSSITSAGREWSPRPNPDLGGSRHVAGPPTARPRRCGCAPTTRRREYRRGR